MEHRKTVAPQKESAPLRFFYHTAVGRFLLKGLSSRFVSKAAGKFLDTRLSRPLIKGFLKRGHIDLADYEAETYRCFNDCFTRRIRPELRPIPPDPDTLISPCDGLLSAYRVTDGTVLPVKQSLYSIADLLGGDRELAERYQNGIALVFRLCVEHYHRYCFPADGEKGESVFLRGKLHTVRPIALETYPVFVRNCREYTPLATDRFGTLTQIEVGALFVGKIANLPLTGRVTRGQEKGCFLYGGSTVILLVEAGKAEIDREFFENTDAGLETSVRMGEPIGQAIQPINNDPA